MKKEEEVRHFINNQFPCVRQKQPHIQGKTSLIPITSSALLEINGLHFLSSEGFEYILFFTDHFTRYTQAYPTRNKTAKTAATHLYKDFVLHFGIPSQLPHDQGGECENAHFQVSCILVAYSKSYLPETNGLTERIN